MRRIFALILTAVMLTFIMVSVTGCSAAKITLGMGQWLTMINDAFGMNSYTSDEPYLTTVAEDNRYFAAVQTAVEWEVIDADQDIDVEAPLTYRDALLTLVNCGEFMDADVSEDEKIDYGIEHFDDTIRKYWMDREISQKDATLLLAEAVSQWAGRSYEKEEHTTFAEGVKDFSQGDAKIEDFHYSEEDSKLMIPETSAPELAEGDVFVMPAGDGLRGTSVFKAENVETKDGQVVVSTSNDLDLYDIAEEVYSQDTFSPTPENTVIRDPDGNIIYDGPKESAELAKSGGYQGLSANADGSITPLTGKEGDLSKEFKIKSKYGDWKIKLSTTLLDGNSDIGLEITSPNLLNIKKTEKQIKADNSEQSVEVSAGFNLNDIDITHKIDYKWFKLRSAEVRVDYDSTLEGSVKASKKPLNKVFAKKISKKNTNVNEYMEEVKKYVIEDANAEGIKPKEFGFKIPDPIVMKLASIDIQNAGLAKVCIDINFQLQVDGSAKLTFNFKGSNGVEYKNNNLRFIKTCDKDVDVEAEVKAELTCGVGPALYLAGLEKKVIGVEARIGLGARYQLTLHLVDSQNHLLFENETDLSSDAKEIIEKMDLEADQQMIKEIAEKQGCTYTVEGSQPVKLHLAVCNDVTVYFILKGGLSTDSYARDLLKNAELSWDVFNEKNAKLLSIHIDVGGNAKPYTKVVPFTNKDLCSFQFDKFTAGQIPSTEASDLTEATEPSETFAPVLEGDNIVVSELFTRMVPGDAYYTNVVQVPKGYTLDDLTMTSDDKNVVSIDEDGVAHAKSPGSTVLTIMTKDEKYKAFIAVLVVGDDTDLQQYSDFAMATKHPSGGRELISG